MFRRHQVTLMSNPYCTKRVEGLFDLDFRYYDKDGFELNLAEQKFYSVMGYPINYPILNHRCWQEPWFELENKTPNLILDHSMFLCRCRYVGEAEHQLLALRNTIPQADMLLRTKQKWGFDFALDAVSEDGTIFEVLHIEYDHCDYDFFKNRMLRFEWTVRHTDWVAAADSIWAARDQWQHLTGFDQNNWKSKYLINWDKAEYTEKSL